MDVSVFDAPRALERVQSDKKFFLELVGIFSQKYPVVLETMIRAISDEDHAALRRGAHELKSSLGNLGAMRCFNSALAIEGAAETKSLQIAREQTEKLEDEIKSFLKAVENFFLDI